MKEASTRKNDPNQLELTAEEMERMGFKNIGSIYRIGDNFDGISYAPYPKKWFIALAGSSQRELDIKYLHQLFCLLTVLGIPFKELV